MKVVFFHRRPHNDYFSIENIYKIIRDTLPSEWSSDVQISRFHSTGIFKRLYITCEAFFRQGDINHITGDINFLAYFMKKKRTLLSIHGTFLPNRSLFIRSIYKYFWIVFPARRVKYITVVSTALKHDLIEHYGCEPQNIIVIKNPIAEVYRYVPKQFEQATPTILQVGTKPQKNIERLIEAVRDINCKLVLVGRLNKLHESLLAKHNIHFENLVDLNDEQMFEQYKRCDIVSFASTYESFGIPIIEGNAVGRAVLTGNVASMPEIANGAANLVDPYSIAAIRSGILELINNDSYREQLIRNGLNNAKQYNKKLITEKYIKLYKQMTKS